MSYAYQIGCALAVSALLAGCGPIGGGCSGIEMDTKHNDLFNTIDVTIRNTSDEPSLVTLSIIDKDGSVMRSNSLRVDTKDIVETRVSNMRAGDGRSVELVSCE